jgi:phosphoribosylpyrophosphate synthetase
MYKFKIAPVAKYLDVAVQGYYHDSYHSGDNEIRRRKGTVENIITMLKNSFGSEARVNLIAAKNTLKNILTRDLNDIAKLSGNQSLTVCVIPRAKKLSAYNSDQLLFKTAVSESLKGSNQLQDGTDFIKRHTNTRTTHLNKSGNGGDGKLPYPGITLETCFISSNVYGKDIILVDDLYTKTVNIDEDAIQALLTRGARSVIFYSLGKTYNTEFSVGQKDNKVVFPQTTSNLSTTHQTTYDLVLQGKKVDQIAAIRGLTKETIVIHIFEIAKIKGSSFARNLMPPVHIIEKVRAAKNKVGSIEKLSPLFEEMGGKVTYNDIRLSLIFLGMK